MASDPTQTTAAWVSCTDEECSDAGGLKHKHPVEPPSQTTDPDDYNPAGPVRTFEANVQFVNAGPMPPMKVELPMTETSSPAVLAGAKFYARASAHRAVHGAIPEWDNGADEANWERTRQSVRRGCIDMVRGILVAAEFPQRQSDAGDRAVSILDRGVQNV